MMSSEEFELLVPEPTTPLAVVPSGYKPLPPNFGDNDVVDAWLSLHTGHTLRAYKRESGAFLTFLEENRIAGLLAVNIEHVRQYLGQLSPSKQRYVYAVLRAFYTWMISVAYARGNPFVAAVNVRHMKKPQRRVDKFLPPDELATLAELVNAMEGKVRNYATRRWIFWLLLHTGLRREEVAGQLKLSEADNPSYVASKRGPLLMSHFQYVGQRFSQAGQLLPTWELQVIGKGDKERIIPVTEGLMYELQRYREYRGLTGLPSSNDISPVVVGPNNQPLSAQGIYSNLKTLACGMAELLDERSPGNPLVENLRKLSPHWMRHTFVTMLINYGISIDVVKDLAGHHSIDTTLGYKGLNADRMADGMARVPSVNIPRGE